MTTKPASRPQLPREQCLVQRCKQPAGQAAQWHRALVSACHRVSASSGHIDNPLCSMRAKLSCEAWCTSYAVTYLSLAACYVHGVLHCWSDTFVLWIQLNPKKPRCSCQKQTNSHPATPIGNAREAMLAEFMSYHHAADDTLLNHITCAHHIAC